jgi:hypothetical protein
MVNTPGSLESMPVTTQVVRYRGVATASVKLVATVPNNKLFRVASVRGFVGSKDVCSWSIEIVGAAQANNSNSSISIITACESKYIQVRQRKGTDWTTSTAADETLGWVIATGGGSNTNLYDLYVTLVYQDVPVSDKALLSSVYPIGDPRVAP